MPQGQFTTVASDALGVKYIVIGYGMFYGGLGQLVAGILEYQRKNTFGTVAFCSYGCFWMALTYFNTIAAVVNGITPQYTAMNNGIPTWKAPIPSPISGERLMVSGCCARCLAMLTVHGQPPCNAASASFLPCPLLTRSVAPTPCAAHPLGHPHHALLALHLLHEPGHQRPLPVSRAARSPLLLPKCCLSV